MTTWTCLPCGAADPPTVVTFDKPPDAKRHLAEVHADAQIGWQEAFERS